MTAEYSYLLFPLKETYWFTDFIVFPSTSPKRKKNKVNIKVLEFILCKVEQQQNFRGKSLYVRDEREALHLADYKLVSNSAAQHGRIPTCLEKPSSNFLSTWCFWMIYISQDENQSHVYIKLLL